MDNFIGEVVVDISYFELPYQLALRLSHVGSNLS